MNSLSNSNRYCVLKRCFNCVLKKKRVSIPFLIEKKDSQIDLETVIAAKNSSIYRYANIERCSTIPLSKGREPAEATPFLVGKDFKQHLSLKGKSFFRALVLRNRALLHNIDTKRDSVFMPAFKKNCVTSLPESISNWTLKNGSSSLVCMTPCTHLPFQDVELNTSFTQLNVLARADKSSCSPCGTNTNEKTECMVVRPLLDLSRGSITAICKHVKIPVYPDRSNQSLHYSRNRLRKQIIPGIQLFFNPQAEDALFKFAELVLQEQDLVSRAIHTTKR